MKYFIVLILLISSISSISFGHSKKTSRLHSDDVKDTTEYISMSCQDLAKCYKGKARLIINNRATRTKYDCMVYTPKWKENRIPILMFYGYRNIDKASVMCELLLEINK